MRYIIYLVLLNLLGFLRYAMPIGMVVGVFVYVWVEETAKYDAIYECEDQSVTFLWLDRSVDAPEWCER